MAQTTFTDGNKVTFSMASNGAEIASFGTVSVNQCVNAYVQERQGNNLDGGSHGARTVTLSSDPAGVAFFAGSGCGTSGSVVTILANTPAAAFSFKISNSSVNQYTINGAAGLTGNNNPSATVTLLTAKANQTISVTAAAPAAAAFGSTFEVAATATSLLPVTITTSGSCSGGDVDGTATITMTAGTGICTVAYNQAGNAAYNAAPPLTNHTAAAKADAVCTVTGYSGTYNAAAHGASGSCAGVADDPTATGSTLDLGTSFTDVPGGTAHWSFTGGTNYNDQAGTVDIEITKADAVCTIHGYSAPYDATAHGASGGCTGVDTGGVALGGTLDLGASFTNVPGGTAHWSFTGGTNYLDEEGDISIVITKADAVCSIHGYDVVFDDAYHTATGTCTGVDGALLAGLDLSGTTHKAADAYVDTWTFVDVTGNYNDRSGTVDDQIRHWTTNGFYQPVDMGASPIVWNTIKGGQTVPLKFNLWAGSQKKTSVSDVRNFVAFPMSCNASSFDSTIELTTTGGTTLRYDGSGGQFIQNWQTPKISGQCYMVRLTALDGSVIEAYFKTK
jgi:hypothetical protein